MQVAAAPARERRVTTAQILEQSCKTTYDFYLGRLMVTSDVPKIMFNLIMDAYQPMLGPYYRVRFPGPLL